MYYIIVFLFIFKKAAVTKGNSPVYLKHLSKHSDINFKNKNQETPIKQSLNQDIKKYSRSIETLI